MCISFKVEIKLFSYRMSRWNVIFKSTRKDILARICLKVVLEFWDVDISKTTTIFCVFAKTLKPKNVYTNSNYIKSTKQILACIFVSFSQFKKYILYFKTHFRRNELKHTYFSHSANHVEKVSNSNK